MESTVPTIAILLAGVVVVVGGILFLRLHAFLALTLAAFLVAALTPQTALQRYFFEQESLSVVDIADDGAVLLGGRKAAGLQSGDRLQVIGQSEGGNWEPVGMLRVDGPASEASALPLRAFPAEGNVSPADLQAGRLLAVTPASTLSVTSKLKQTIGGRVAEGFGNTCMKIGILIAMAGIIGKCLLDSGAADRIVRTALRWFGEPGAPVAFMSSGFLLGVPVFFDTVFYLMIPLGKAMRMRTGRNYLLYVLTIVCGATMAHSLVPPTPGPLLVAEELNVNLGTMILAGSIVGLFCAAFGLLYASMANRIWDLPLRDSPDMSLAELEELAQVDESQLPSFGIAILPILLPVVLISGYTIIQQQPFGLVLSPDANRVAATLGDKNIALVLSALVAIVMLVWQKRTTRQELSHAVGAALSSAGVIILITAAGGAFGAVLRQTGVASLISQLPRTSPIVICSLAFLITTAIRTAQGSATVAMITAVGILSGLARDGNLGFHPVYLALAIGCGSKPIAWMNDSGFWVITRMSGMTEAEGLKFITPMTTCMGLVGLAVVLAGVTLFPMAG
ncbi:Low-affinity gluconate transporter [Maioricimonas rarisocia]|uniref:Low-affinity gluconate transporter n=1 Tax=Maioricimonas rarisocia TaxID=2528026 RepID=A0A517Z072_9PLAN|nr:GntP family permease [Maioricimonas rarisocia]QDU35819.1 Low-affinity gluconate transporter [Maioricimonas rarisocia]